MNAKIIHFDVIENVTYDSSEDKLHVERIQDVEPILEANKRDFNATPETGRYKKPMVLAARIPLIVVEQWLKMGVNIFDPSPETKKKVRQLLNSPEWSYLKTHRGRI